MTQSQSETPIFYDKNLNTINEDIEIDDAIDEDTISLEESENDVQVISEEVDDLDIGDSNPENIDEQ